MPEAQTPPANPQAQTPPQTPQIAVPDKFKNPDGTPNWEGMAKSYVEMEKEYTRLKQGGSQPPAEATPSAPSSKPSLTIETPPPGIEALTEEIVLKRAGLKPEDIEKQWVENGDLTPEMYSAFGRAGLSKDMARNYVEGRAAKAELESQRVLQFQKEAEQIAGGPDKHAMLREWAKANIDQSKLAGWNANVKANPAFYPDMMRLIAMEYTQKVGEKPNLVNANSSTPGGVQPAKDGKEYAALIREYQQTANPAILERIKATKPSQWAI